ncbi:MAG: family 16 glycosylhydrolase [Bacteroidia bacterium]
MKRMTHLFNFLLLGYLLASIPLRMQAQPCLQMIWSEEFDGTALDTNLWNYEIGNAQFNNEQQYYSDSPENIKVENGRLVITAREDSLGLMSYSSAKITSLRKGDFRYGRFEARMKFPLTQGMWPAFWMLPTEKVYGEWPESGEMDIVEMIGSKPSQAVGTLHTGLPHTYISGYYDLPPGETFADTFHVFTMEWEPDSVTWFVDGIKYHQLTPNDISPWAPFQEEFHLILNLAVGGTWPGPVDPTTVFPQTMEVDYVRVYNRPERLSIKGDQPMVEAVGLEYSTFDIAGANYIWTVPSDASIISGQGTHQVTVDWGCTFGNVDLELQTLCDTATLSYDVSGFAVPALSGPNTVIENQSGITYAISQASSGTFSWEVPAGASIISGQGNNQIVVDWGCDPGEVIVAFNSSCGTTFNDTLPVALPTYAISGQTSVLPSSSNRTYSIAEIPSATYAWSVPSDVSIISGLGTSAIQIDFGNTTGVISVTVVTPCGTNTYDIPFVIEESFLYVDFDSTDLEFIGYDNAVFKKVANPSPSGINVSDSVGRVNKMSGASFFAGIEADVFEIALGLRPVMTQKVYSSATGIVRFMLDDETTGMERLKIDMNYGPADANQWVQMVYDFTGAPDETYDQLRLTYNHFSTTTELWYFDDVIAWPDLNAVTSLEAGITELIEVYPNPSSGLYSIDSKDIFPLGSTYQLEVLDMQGRSILKREIIAQGQPVAFDLSDQPTGLYYLRLSRQSLHYLKAIVKKE